MLDHFCECSTTTTRTRKPNSKDIYGNDVSALFNPEKYQPTKALRILCSMARDWGKSFDQAYCDPTKRRSAHYALVFYANFDHARLQHFLYGFNWRYEAHGVCEFLK